MATRTGLVWIAMALAGAIAVPASAQWTFANTEPLARFDAAVAIGLDGTHIYAFGGFHTGVDTNYLGLSQSEVCDDLGNHGRWTPIAPMPAPRAGGPAVAARGADGRERIYVFGGWVGETISPYTPTSSVLAYDVASNSWSELDPMQSDRALEGAVLAADGRIYVFGGYTTGGQEVDSMEVFDPLAGNGAGGWLSATFAPMLNRGRAAMATVAGADGRIYAIGGSRVSQRLREVDAYELPSTAHPQGRWTSLAPLTHPRYRPAAVLAHDGRILVSGGYDATVLGSYEYFDGAQWSEPTAHMNAARYDHASVTDAQGRIWVIGGFGGSDEVTSLFTVEVLAP